MYTAALVDKVGKKTVVFQFDNSSDFIVTIQYLH